MDTPSQPTGKTKTITATVGNVNPADRELRLYTGVVNEFGKELPVVISFEEILEIHAASFGSSGSSSSTTSATST